TSPLLLMSGGRLAPTVEVSRNMAVNTPASKRNTPPSAEGEFTLARKTTTPPSLIAGSRRVLKVPASGAGRGSPVLATTAKVAPVFVITALVVPRKATTVALVAIGCRKKSSFTPSEAASPDLNSVCRVAARTASGQGASKKRTGAASPRTDLRMAPPRGSYRNLGKRLPRITPGDSGCQGTIFTELRPGRRPRTLHRQPNHLRR